MCCGQKSLGSAVFLVAGVASAKRGASLAAAAAANQDPLPGKKLQDPVRLQGSHS